MKVNLLTIYYRRVDSYSLPPVHSFRENPASSTITYTHMLKLMRREGGREGGEGREGGREGGRGEEKWYLLMTMADMTGNQP